MDILNWFMIIIKDISKVTTFYNNTGRDSKNKIQFLIILSYISVWNLRKYESFKAENGCRDIYTKCNIFSKMNT